MAKENTVQAVRVERAKEDFAQKEKELEGKIRYTRQLIVKNDDRPEI